MQEYLLQQYLLHGQLDFFPFLICAFIINRALAPCKVFSPLVPPQVLQHPLQIRSKATATLCQWRGKVAHSSSSKTFWSSALHGFQDWLLLSSANVSDTQFLHWPISPINSSIIPSQSGTIQSIPFFLHPLQLLPFCSKHDEANLHDRHL